MTLQDQLDKLRSQTPGCKLSAYGDISSGLILRNSAAHPYPREKLDALCAKANETFSYVVINELGGPDTSASGQTAVYFSTDQTFVFARVTDTAHEVVCLILDRAQRIEPALAASLETAQVIEDTAV